MKNGQRANAQSSLSSAEERQLKHRGYREDDADRFERLEVGQGEPPAKKPGFFEQRSNRKAFMKALPPGKDASFEELSKYLSARGSAAESRRRLERTRSVGSHPSCSIRNLTRLAQTARLALPVGRGSR